MDAGLAGSTLAPPDTGGRQHLEPAQQSFDTIDPLLGDEIAAALGTDGYVVVPAPLPGTLVDSLFIELKTSAPGAFHRAGIGRDHRRRVNRFVRRDRILWIDGSTPATAAWLRWTALLREALNRRLLLGLFDYECHFACYPRGGFYRRHRDAFLGQRNRIVSTVLYLNPGWVPGTGGELLLYDDSVDSGGDPVAAIEPLYGRLVLFLSERFPHEVAVTTRKRYSIAGWYRVNATTFASLDPPR